jgi:hypothetical protein
MKQDFHSNNKKDQTMITYRNALAMGVIAAALAGCLPPVTTLKVASTAPGAVPGTSVTVDLGQSVVLSWTGDTLMTYGNGAAFIEPRDYKITPSDPYASPLVIEENCATGLVSDWNCIKPKRSGSFTVNPYVSGTYTLTAAETVTAILPPADKQTFTAAPVTVTVNVNMDVAIADVIGHVTDAKLRGCINALGLTRVNEVVNLSCPGSLGSVITTLAGLEYFYALETLDISGNLVLDTVHAQAPRYMANPQYVNLNRSGLNCTNQNAIEAALRAKNPAVVVTKGTSTNTCS